MTNFRPLSETDYNSFAFQLIKKLEGGSQLAYVDTAGIPTIGIGFNLKANMNLVLQAMGIDTTSVDGQALLAEMQEIVDGPWQPDQNEGLQLALNDAYQASPLNTSDAEFFLNDEQMSNLFLQFIETFENQVTGAIPVAVPDSYERAVFLSLRYNSVIKGQETYTDPNTNEVKYVNWGITNMRDDDALLNEDPVLARAATWFEIEFNSNDHVKRRAIEGATYQLYESRDGAQTLEEAISVTRFLYGKSGYDFNSGTLDVFVKVESRMPDASNIYYIADMEIDEINSALGYDSTSNPIYRPILPMWQMAYITSSLYHLDSGVASDGSNWSADYLKSYINWQLAIQSDKHFQALVEAAQDAGSDFTLDWKIIDLFKADAATSVEVRVADNTKDGNGDYKGGTIIAPSGKNAILLGSEGDDTITTGDGGTKSVVLGMGGNDTITGGGDGETGSDDLIDGGEGDDRISGGAGNDTIFGGIGTDTMVGNAGDDIIEGRTDTDELIASLGHSNFFGGLGSDLVKGSRGADFIFDRGSDTPWEILKQDPATVELAAAEFFAYDGLGNDTIYGGKGSDILVYSGGNDTFYGGEGNDLYLVAPEAVASNAATDHLNIVLEGNFGHDLLAGDGHGIDQVTFAGLSKDSVTVNYSISKIEFVEVNFKGVFDPLMGFNNMLSVDAKNLGVYRVVGTLEIIVTGTQNSLTIDNVVGSYAKPMTDWSYSGVAFLNLDYIDLMFSDGELNVQSKVRDQDNPHLLVNSSLSADAFAAVDALEKERSVIEDTLTGNEDKDNIDGDNGSEYMAGLAGDDNMSASDGTDVLNGGTGADRLDGGAGSDTATYRDATSRVVANLRNPNDSFVAGEAVGDQYISIENLEGSAHNDVLIGDDFANELRGLNGDDVLSGYAGDDDLIGGAGHDNLTGGVGHDLLEGGAGNDTLIGGSESDTMLGGAGDDLFQVYYNVFIDISLAQDWVRPLGQDLIEGGDGIDTIEFGEAFSGLMLVGSNQVTVAGGAVVIDMIAGRADFGANGDVTKFTGIENVTGGDGADIIVGDQQHNLIIGRRGSDSLLGGGGNDTLLGDGGNSYGLDTDSIFGGAGVDTARINATTNVVSFSAVDGGIKVTIDAGAPEHNYNMDDGSFIIYDDVEFIQLNDATLTYAQIAGPLLTEFAVIDDNIRVTEGTTATIEPFANDLLIAGAPLTLLKLNGQVVAVGDILRLESGARVQVLANGQLDYLQDGAWAWLDAGETGSETLTYEATDATGVVRSASINLIIDGVQTAGNTTHLAGDTVNVAANPEGVTMTRIGNFNIGADKVVIGSLVVDPLSVQAGVTLFEQAGSTYIGFGDDLVELTGVALDAWRYMVEQLRIAGNPGNDTIYGTSSSDTLYGGGGNDRIEDTSATSDLLYGGNGDDLLYTNGGKDSVYGGAGNDTLKSLGSGDLIDGGAGTDLLDMSFSSNATVTNLTTGLQTLSGGAGTDQLLGIENVRGTSGANTITGNAIGNWLDGFSGSDSIDGQAGNDTLYGGAGSDTLVGGDGDDQLEDTSSESDKLYGGNGADIVYSNGGKDSVYGGVGDDTMKSLGGGDVIDGGDGVDVLDISFSTIATTTNLNTGTMTLVGFSGTDQLISIEHVIGTKGSNSIIGNALANRLDGHEGDDSVTGMDGDDSLIGGLGNDTLHGGSGADVMTGGAGNDSFQFKLIADGGDRISDFETGDTIGISASGFGAGLVVGSLNSGQFQSRSDNQAQDADDRFIFRTTDKTLWFDSNGEATGGLTMIAQLDVGSVTAATILLF